MKEKSLITADMKVSLVGQLEALKARKDQLTRLMIPIEQQIQGLNRSLESLIEDRLQISAQIQQKKHEIEVLETTQLRAALVIDTARKLAEGNAVLFRSGNPLVNSFAGVVDIVLNNGFFVEALPDIVEPSLATFSRKSNGSRIMVEHKDESCRLVLADDGTHVVMFYPRPVSADYDVVENIRNSAELVLASSPFTSSYKIAYGVGIKIDVADPEVATPVFMVQIGERNSDAISACFPFEPSEDFLPITQKINTILSFGTIKSPREVKSIASAVTIRS